MNSSQQFHNSAADEQAALWAARLDGDSLDQTQRAELDAWLAKDPAHRALLSQYCQFSADLEEQIPVLVSSGAVALPEPPASKRARWSFPRIMGLAVAAAAAVAVTVNVLRPAPQVQTFAQASAQRGACTLADGTRVELNANTSVRFENSKTERRVRMAGGEALFHVAKDSSRPFTVETPAGSVRVTGTTFNVRTELTATGLEVTVVEGSIQVRPADARGAQPNPLPLIAGEQFSSRGGGVRPMDEKAIEDALAWRNGKVVFYDTPLNEAIARFAQYHGRAIHVSAEVAGERVGGRYSLDDLMGFLAGLELVLPRVKVHTDMSGVVFVELRPGS